MSKLLHIADLHLGFAHRYLGTRADERADEAVRIFERIIDWACDPAQEISAILIAGDLFETHAPDSEVVGRVLAALGKAVSAQKQVVTLPGNHDEYSYPESVYRGQAERWPGILVTSPTPQRVASFDLDDAAVHLYSMAYTAGLSPDRLPQIDTQDADVVRIALLHGTLDAAPADRTYRIDSKTLRAAGIHYAALGHIHKPRETRLVEGLALYPGSPIGKGFDDPGVDHLVTVAFSGKRPVIERVPFPARCIESRQIDLARFDTFDALVTGLEERADPERIVQLRLTGPRPAGFDPDHLRGRLESAFYHLEVDDLSIEIAADEIASLEHQPTMRGLFTQLMHERLDEARAASDTEREACLKLALRQGLTAFEEVGARGRES
ncbi:MAG: hypothetical protein GF330_01590 [Candidatus Eisenbacteria bacterium]|nr:hypothetical protein [Candidatus Eisenbacteria bacterium]